MPTRRDLAMTTQSLLDFTDLVILVAFAASLLALIAYLWRSGHRHGRLR